MMACAEPLMKQEQALTDVLKSTRRYRIVGETLELIGDEGVVARFKRTR